MFLCVKELFEITQYTYSYLSVYPVHTVSYPFRHTSAGLSDLQVVYIRTQPHTSRALVTISSAHSQVELYRQPASRCMIYRPVKVPTITQSLLGNRIALIGSHHARARPGQHPAMSYLSDQGEIVLVVAETDY